MDREPESSLDLPPKPLRERGLYRAIRPALPHSQPMKQTPFTLWLATARKGDTFARVGIHDTTMALSARRAGRIIETAKCIAVNGMRTFPVTIATMKDNP